MKNLNLSEQDWLKLRDFNKQIAINIKKRLPTDWQLSLEEIEGAVYDTFVKLLNNYKEGAMSPTSYCWQFAEQYTYRDLIREYSQLKNQCTFDLMFGEDYDDRVCKHTYGVADVPSLTVDEREKQMVKDEVKTIMDKANLIDRTIMQMVMDGKTMKEIADEVGISTKQISRRLQKYRGLAR